MKVFARKSSKNLCYYFADLNHYYLMRPQQDAVVFACQARTWNQKQANTQLNSLARGMKHFNFIEYVILLRLAPHQHIEKLAFKVAASNLRCKVIESMANDQEELEKELKENRVRALVFDSYGSLGDSTNIDTLYRMIPSMVHLQKNKEVLPMQFRFLRYLVQTDRYNFPGTFTFQSFIRHGLQTDYDFSFDCDQKAAILGPQIDLKRPIIITNPADDLAFRAGVINSLQNGSLLFCCLPNQVNEIASKFEYKVDFIGTEKVEDLHDSIQVFVKSNSSLWEGRKNRVQIC